MFIRWLKFNTVGAIGIAVQLSTLWLFKGMLGWHYLLSTTLAVETAILHNFFWHHYWTWSGRRETSALGRLLRFHLSNGLISIFSNLVLMRVFAGWLGFHYLAANLLAIAVTSVTNFLLSEYFVFRRARPQNGWL